MHGGLRADEAVWLDDVVLGLGQHAAGTAGGVIDGDDGRELVLHGLDEQVDHELDDLARGEVLAGLLVVLFVELADEFLEDVTHAEICEAGHLPAIRRCGVVRAEIDLRRNELLQHAKEGIGLVHLPNLCGQVELGDDLADVVAVAVEVVGEIGNELGGIPEQGFQGELGGVVKHLPGSVLQPLGVQHGHLGLLLLKAHLLQHGGLGVLQQAINAPQHEHGQDDIPVFPAHKDIPQAVVCDGPNEGDDFVVCGVVH